MLSISIGWVILGVLSVSQVSLGAVFFQHPDDILLGQAYDFIVIGGGAGGGAVATRVAENKTFKVLLIEAGPSDKDVFEIQVPGLHPLLVGGRIDWNFTTVPQVQANNRVLEYSRAKVLGGCTSHNGMVYTRGSKDDYNRWAAIAGDESYSWDNMLPYILKSERLMPDVEHQVEQGHLDPTVHGRTGGLAVCAPYSDHPINELFLRAASELKEEFPFKLDFNDGRPIGIGWTQETINQGFRSSSVTAFLAKTGDNVHVLLNTYVTRVLPTSSDGKDLRRVEFGTDASDLRQLDAQKEVIISGGIINTPQILLNSGIGNKRELERLGIRVRVDNPSVGKNLSDQVSINGTFDTTLPVTTVNMTEALAEWNATRTGPLSRQVALNHLGWVRLSRESPALRNDRDPSGGGNSPHIEIFPVGILPVSDTSTITQSPGTRGLMNSFVFLLFNLHPTSRGSVSLRSSDPFEHPLIDFNLLNTNLDMAILRESIRSIQRLFSASVWKDKVFDMTSPPINATANDESLNSYIRSVAVPILHAVGTASMSPRGASWGVVDPDFKVKGVRGLRVVDASVLPLVPSGHTQAPVYAFGERAAELIRRTWEV